MDNRGSSSTSAGPHVFLDLRCLRGVELLRLSLQLGGTVYPFSLGP